MALNVSAQNIIQQPNTIDEFKEICKDYKLVEIKKGDFSEMPTKIKQVKDYRLGNLCSDLKYFARIHKKNEEQKSAYGTWVYTIIYSSEDSTIIITGNQATGLPRYKMDIYKTKANR